MSLIQNEGLDEHKVRDLNDSINKLMREKGHWERQIKSPAAQTTSGLHPRSSMRRTLQRSCPGRATDTMAPRRSCPA